MSRRTPTLLEQVSTTGAMSRDYVVVFQDVKFSRLGSPVGLITNTVRWISVEPFAPFVLKKGLHRINTVESPHIRRWLPPKSTYRLPTVIW